MLRITTILRSRIFFWLSQNKRPHTSKPIHGSHAILPEPEQERLRKMYTELEGYLFLRIECIPNNELKEVFFSFDKEIVVLHKGIQEEMMTEMERQMALLLSICKKT